MTDTKEAPRKTLSLLGLAAKKAAEKIAKVVVPAPVILPEPVTGIPVTEPEQSSMGIPIDPALPQSVHRSLIREIMQRVEYRFDVFANTVLCHGLLDGKFLLATAMYAAVSNNKFDEGKGRLAARKEAQEMAENAIKRFEGYALYQNIYNGKKVP